MKHIHLCLAFAIISLVVGLSASFADEKPAKDDSKVTITLFGVSIDLVDFGKCGLCKEVTISDQGGGMATTTMKDCTVPARCPIAVEWIHKQEYWTKVDMIFESGVDSKPRRKCHMTDAEPVEQFKWSQSRKEGWLDIPYLKFSSKYRCEKIEP